MTTEHESYSDEDIRNILNDTTIIAMIGASANPERPSHRVMTYLQQIGFRVVPVNPGIAGNELLGETVYASLSDIPESIDMVNVFRRTDAIPAIVEEVLPLIQPKGIRYLWLQLEIYDIKSALSAREAGLQVVMDRCLKIEHTRLFG